MSDTLDTNNVVDEVTTTQDNVGEVKKVEMTQDELNSLINKKYGQGAEKSKAELLSSLGVESLDSLKEIIEAKKQQDEASKSELEKMQEKLDAMQSERDNLLKQFEETQKKNKISQLALQNGIEDVDYLEYKYNKASSQEGFDESKFIEEFKGTSQSALKQTPKVDTSSNKQNEVSLQDLSLQAKQLVKEGKVAEAQKLLNQIKKGL